MHVLNDNIPNNSKAPMTPITFNFCIKVTGRMSSRTCYTRLNFDFPYVRSFSLRRDTNIDFCTLLIPTIILINPLVLHYVGAVVSSAVVIILLIIMTHGGEWGEGGGWGYYDCLP